MPSLFRPNGKFLHRLPQKAGCHEVAATFAQGCFWHSEIVFQSLTGVRDAVSGFAGGKTVNPSYEDVCTGKTGHAESVQVYYDSTKISYAELVSAYFASMDPTSLNRQGNDVGTEYRSVAFYRNEKEKKIIENEIARINASGKYSGRVVTEVRPFSAFYPAEQYHQEYIITPGTLMFSGYPFPITCISEKRSRPADLKTNIPVSLFTECLVHFVSKKITDDRTGDDPCGYPPGRFSGSKTRLCHRQIIYTPAP
ncbi:MAG: peptide-methionine (S)-S-oxide reductase MsrA [Ferruginibacter sp.]